MLLCRRNKKNSWLQENSRQINTAVYLCNLIALRFFYTLNGDPLVIFRNLIEGLFAWCSPILDNFVKNYIHGTILSLCEWFLESVSYFKFNITNVSCFRGDRSCSSRHIWLTTGGGHFYSDSRCCVDRCHGAFLQTMGQYSDSPAQRTPV